MVIYDCRLSLIILIKSTNNPGIFATSYYIATVLNHMVNMLRMNSASCELDFCECLTLTLFE